MFYEQKNEIVSLATATERSLGGYFEKLEGEATTGVYAMVLAEIEKPMLKVVLKSTGGNQHKASIILGLNRGTLRKKLKKYGLLF